MEGEGYLRLSLSYEKHVRSLPALERELKLLDGDAGVRLEGRYRGKKCFAFVTRFGKTYSAMVCSSVKRGNSQVPGRSLAWVEFASVSDVVTFLAALATPSVSAYVY